MKCHAGAGRVVCPPAPRRLVPRGVRPARRCGVPGAQSQDASETLLSEAERFVASIAAEQPAQEPVEESLQLQTQSAQLAEQAAALQSSIDALYASAFRGVELPPADADADAAAPMELPAGIALESLTEAQFGEVGRQAPALLQALITAKDRADPRGWLAFQSEVSALKLRRSRLEQEAAEAGAAAEAAARRERAAAAPSDYDALAGRWDAAARSAGEASTSGAGSADEGDSGGAERPARSSVKIVLVTGFESFNVELYKRAAVELARTCPAASLRVFSDRDLGPRRAEVEAALAGADVFFGSLLFDFDQVEWLRQRVRSVPVRLVFESALELMGETRVGSFEMALGGKAAGPPPAVKKVLSLFGSGREEDKLVGYLSFLKIGPKLLKFLPGKKARDLRTWLTTYSYWNQGGLQNVVAMLSYLLRECFTLPAPPPPPPEVVETPATGCLHPSAPGRYFSSPADYARWYEREGPVRDPGAPRVAVLLYRKHVITDQPYIPDLITCMEAQGLVPVPIFINGVEAHTVVRDQLTTEREQAALRAGAAPSPTLRRDAVRVDAVVNTIGFPLVGGPAGTMEGGRQSDIAKAILSTKDVPYVVAAPLLIQDMDSWVRDGVAGLQSVVLYSLPELDGAIDTVPLGGLVGDNIYLVPERVTRLAARLQKWIALRRSPPSERRLAILLYGFPPGVGAAGTAALLNVPRSLEALLRTLRSEGYDLGDLAEDLLDGEALVAALRAQEDQRALSKGAAGVEALGAGPAAAMGARAVAADVSAARLKAGLTFPESWGPTEWGPIPFLPDNDILVRRMEAQWGELGRYRGLSTSARGDAVVSGLQLGNVFIGVQPMLGVEGDPMRLLFERDLTPHPQYAAFYKWLQNDFAASAVLHFGMHGTVEWLPGAPLGNSGFSWSDVLLGNLPNVYVYAANNPSESIVAKRRGYGTIVSHNVPPYGRAGLYKQLAELKAVVGEYRDSGAEGGDTLLRGPIVELLAATGLDQDCPFVDQNNNTLALGADSVGGVDPEAFAAYVSRLYVYLQEVEGRLYSEGLHVLGAPPTPEQSAQYLAAYFGEDLSEEAVAAVAHAERAGGLEAVRARLERALAASAPPPGNTITTSGGGGGAGGAVVDAGKLEEAVRIRDLLGRNTEELTSVVAALNGEYVLPAAGGDLLRDGAGVLPTGRNIHALDPYRMPSAAAMERGRAAAEAILIAHRDQNDGAWPETVAVNLWGLDAIKTKGESVGIALALVGARPVKEGTGRVARFELIPLEELGRPRIDVLCNMSGIFRDSFQNVVELLDDCFQRAAAAADEPPEMNFPRKHSAAMAAQGIANPSARLFSNPAGDYGSMVNERVGAGTWEDGDELGATWAARNAFSYGRGAERGTARPEVLQALLASTDRVVQEVDSVEYGLTDIQEYYANTGALRRAAQSAKGPGGASRRVGCSIVEAFSREVRPRELEDVLRLEYRSKLLNPKWAEAMAAQGSGGAFEISQRMTAMVGWGATVDFKENWAWDQAAATYALDPAMAARLRRANPQAFSNLLKRMLEAAGRGMWEADEATLEALRAKFAEMDDELEGVGQRKL